MSMMCRPMWPFSLMYESHDMRHTGFLQVDDGQRDPREMGPHICGPVCDWFWHASGPLYALFESVTA